MTPASRKHGERLRGIVYSSRLPANRFELLASCGLDFTDDLINDRFQVPQGLLVNSALLEPIQDSRHKRRSLQTMARESLILSALVCYTEPVRLELLSLQSHLLQIDGTRGYL